VTKQFIYKKSLILSFFNILLILFALTSCNHEDDDGTEISTIVAMQNQAQWWQDRHQEILNTDKSDIEILFIGDSITQRWEEDGLSIWQQNFLEGKAFNMGFNGDKTQNLLWRLENGELDNINPKVTFLLIGTNNSEDNNAIDIAEGILKNVEIITAKLPETKLIILKIFPRGDKDSKYRRVTHDASEIVAKTILNTTTLYLDINDHFVDSEDNIPAELMMDKLHLTDEGYEIWANAISHLIPR